MCSMPGDMCLCVVLAMRPIGIIMPLYQDKGTHIKVHSLSHECQCLSLSDSLSLSLRVHVCLYLRKKIALPVS
jgi:hypothetical protein